MEKPKVLVICGPTASGKTALSIEIAKKTNGEIVSADSMQIYKDMDIGTAKPTKEEMQGIKHYLVGFVSPDERYSVADFKRDAKDALREIVKKGKTPIDVYNFKKLCELYKAPTEFINLPLNSTQSGIEQEEK